ncbi:hypothetical protein OG21DRAFT_1428574, partial [Imleria badia]
PSSSVLHSAGKVYDVSQTFLDRFGMDTYLFFRRSNLYYPFASHNDWQVANYLLQSGLSMVKINKYLKLNLVHFFFSDRTFATHSRIIASGRYRLFPFHFRLRRGCENPVILYYHDALDCIESLFNHPYYAPHMDYTPFHLFTMAERIV